MVSELDNRPQPAGDTTELAPWVVPFFVVAAVGFIGAGLVFVFTTVF